MARLTEAIGALAREARQLDDALERMERHRAGLLASLNRADAMLGKVRQQRQEVWAALEVLDGYNTEASK